MQSTRLSAALAALVLAGGVALGPVSTARGDTTSIAGAGGAGWTTAPSSAVQAAPRPVSRARAAAPAPAAPVALTAPAPLPAPMPAPMPAPAPMAFPAAEPLAAAAPLEAASAAKALPPAAPPQAPARATVPSGVSSNPLASSRYSRVWDGSGLPSDNGISMWYLTGVFGRSFHSGDDPADPCWYWGFDAGRSFCGNWGMDTFYRYHSGQYERDQRGQPSMDGGSTNHVGFKLTYDIPLAGDFYIWTGAGPEYWWTQDYLNDDSGVGVYAESGLGWVITRRLRLRAGVNVHGMDSDVTRKDPANDGQSRWLWVVAPVVQAEFAF